MPGFSSSSNRKRGSSNCLFLGCPKLRNPFFSVPRKKSTAQGDCNADIYAGDRIILLLFVPVRCTKPVVHFPIKWSDNLIRFRKFSSILSLHNPCIQSGRMAINALRCSGFLELARFRSHVDRIPCQKVAPERQWVTSSQQEDRTVFPPPLIYASVV